MAKKDLLKLLKCVIVSDADNNKIKEKKVKQALVKNLFDFKFKINLNVIFLRCIKLYFLYNKI
jgi:hypothetical protein